MRAARAIRSRSSDSHPSPIDIDVLVASMRAEVDAMACELVLDRSRRINMTRTLAVKLGPRLGGRQAGWRPGTWLNGSPLIHNNSGLAFGVGGARGPVFQSYTSRYGTLLLRGHSAHGRHPGERIRDAHRPCP